MDELKSKSMASCRIWKSAGKPRSGPIFDIYRKDKSAYKNGISLRRRNENMVYTNDLHDALLKKNKGIRFGSAGGLSVNLTSNVLVK